MSTTTKSARNPPSNSASAALGEFLRAMRSRTKPGSVSISSVGQRRVPGLPPGRGSATRRRRGRLVHLARAGTQRQCIERCPGAVACRTSALTSRARAPVRTRPQPTTAKRRLRWRCDFSVFGGVARQDGGCGVRRQSPLGCARLERRRRRPLPRPRECTGSPAEYDALPVHVTHPAVAARRLGDRRSG
jgi:hypothetical protein